MVLYCTTGFSQDSEGFVSKKGTPILPEKGDLSFGIDVVPFFNIFKTGTKDAGFNPVADQTRLTVWESTESSELNYFIAPKLSLCGQFRWYHTC